MLLWSGMLTEAVTFKMYKDCPFGHLEPSLEQTLSSYFSAYFVSTQNTTRTLRSSDFQFSLIFRVFNHMLLGRFLKLAARDEPRALTFSGFTLLDVTTYI
jgi:hypothetical protein